MTALDVPMLQSRYRGALLGLAAGDALGTTLEFTRPGSFAPLDDMVGGGPFGLQPGQWTDDTSMALCLAVSLVERGGFDPRDQAERYLRWWREGWMSSTGVCFDIGGTVRAALTRFERTGEPYAGATDPNTAGNGSIMRLAPVVLAYAHDAALAIEQAADSSRVTHAAPQAVDACRYMAGLLVGLLRGEPKDVVLAPGYAPLPGLWERQPLHPEVAAVAAGSFRTRRPPAIRGTGYAVASLEAALWAFAATASFRDGCLAAVNLGEDADTTGAVFGQLAGACYGAEGIPAPWRERLTEQVLITRLADGLLVLSEGLAGAPGELRLLAPDERWAVAFAAMAREYAAAGDNRYMRTASDVGAYVHRLSEHAAGRGLLAGRVPETTRWAALDGALVGCIRLRHRLTPDLLQIGGHIGYDIRPALRGRGHGTRMLALMLPHARALGLGRVLITCDATNIASARVIEKNGGVRESQHVDSITGALIYRYWIDL